MGSTGSNSFSDYTNHPTKNSNQGGASEEDKCGKAFSTGLEEVQNCSYYINNRNVPPAKTPVRVTFIDPRLAVEANGEVFGYLPTKYNYLRVCMASGKNYVGEVLISGTNPIPAIHVDILPA